MVPEKDNRILTEVGPGTPGGELLRRYWHPIAALSEMDERDAKPCGCSVKISCSTRTGAGSSG